MTKTREIEMLDSMIATFGPHSYLGPWLAENREALAADIRNDLTPDAVLPSAARTVAASLIVDAKAEAGTIKRDATVWAAELRDRTRADVDTARTAARMAIERIAAGLGGRS